MKEHLWAACGGAFDWWSLWTVLWRNWPLNVPLKDADPELTHIMWCSWFNCSISHYGHFGSSQSYWELQTSRPHYKNHSCSFFHTVWLQQTTEIILTFWKKKEVSVWLPLICYLRHHSKRILLSPFPTALLMYYESLRRREGIFWVYLCVCVLYIGHYFTFLLCLTRKCRPHSVYVSSVLQPSLNQTYLTRKIRSRLVPLTQDTLHRTWALRFCLCGLKWCLLFFYFNLTVQFISMFRCGKVGKCHWQRTDSWLELL